MNKEFKTKLNIDDNTFFRQNINGVTKYSGINHFGVPLNERRLGPDIAKASILSVEQKNEVVRFINDDTSDTLKLTILTYDGDITFTLHRDEALNNNLKIDSDYLGFEPYEIKGVEFFKGYTWFVIEGDNLNNEEFKLTKLTKYTSSSLDYAGDDKILTVAGDVEVDRIFGLHTYTPHTINTDFKLVDAKNNPFLIHNEGDLIFDGVYNGFSCLIVSDTNKTISLKHDEVVTEIHINETPTSLFFINNKIYIK